MSNPHRPEKRSVLVTGAGFSRAFLPDSPLLVDDFGADDLAAKVKGLSKASRLLDWERGQHREGFIDIERLMTRLHSLMPYDDDQGATDEYRFLLSELMDHFLTRLKRVRAQSKPHDSLANVARHCVDNHVDCITFNYDDVLDEVLAGNLLERRSGWHPDGGYGFYCQDSIGTIGAHWNADIGDPTPMLLLKLHGSINWRPRKGYTEPYVLDAITHHEQWPRDDQRKSQRRELVERHLESSPLITPPVLSKSGLVRQPVLRLIWALAYEKLAKAHRVTFVGYSFPATDMAAQTLFSEALRDIPRDAINVVNLARTEAEEKSITERYRSILGHIPDRQFDFSGALTWSKALIV